VNYDLIGDIHGYSEPLVELLTKLGYSSSNSVYRHPKRSVIFLGDFIDRGPNQREVIEIVRPMIDEGAALTVMGNHEFNAISYSTHDPEDTNRHLRVHSEKNRNQHKAFLDAYDGTPDYSELIDWFRTLPLWLDLGSLRVIHACWDEKLMKFLTERYSAPQSSLDSDFIVRASRRECEEFEAIETLLKGKEVKIPRDSAFFDNDGNPRRNMRIRWWDGNALTYQDAFLGPNVALRHIPEDPIDAEHLIGYTEDDPPLFLGHYWLDGEIDLLAPNIACLDYSVAAKENGRLVAYCWDGEPRLSREKFVHVSR